MRNKLLMLTIITSIAINQPVLHAGFSFTNNNLFRFAKSSLFKKTVIISGIATIIGILALWIKNTTNAPQYPARRYPEGHPERQHPRGIDEEVDKTTENEDNLIKAAELNNISQVKYFINQGTNINAKKWQYDGNKSAIEVATNKGSLDVVKYLLEKDAKISNTIQKNILQQACSAGRKDIVEHFVDKEKVGVNGIILNQHGTPLHVACFNGNVELSQYLVEHGADVNAKDNSLRTPFYEACRNGNVQLVRYLLEHNADINTTAIIIGERKTPLYAATERGHIEIVQLLVEHGAHVNVRSEGKTPLIIATERNNSALVRYLIEQGANVNDKALVRNGRYGNQHPGQKTRCGDTSLHIASKKGYIGIADYLIKNGADINKKADNKTPFEAACESGYLKTAKTLAERGATISRNYQNLIPQRLKNDKNKKFTKLKNLGDKTQEIEQFLDEIKEKKDIQADDIEKTKQYIENEKTPTVTKQSAIKVLSKIHKKNKKLISETELKGLFKKVPFNKEFLTQRKYNKLVTFAAKHKATDIHGKSVVSAAITNCDKKESIEKILSYALENCGNLYNADLQDFQQWLNNEDKGKKKTTYEDNDLANALQVAKKRNKELYKQTLNRLYIHFNIEKIPVPKENFMLPKAISSQIAGFLDNHSLSQIAKHNDKKDNNKKVTKGKKQNAVDKFFK